MSFSLARQFSLFERQEFYAQVTNSLHLWGNSVSVVALSASNDSNSSGQISQTLQAGHR